MMSDNKVVNPFAAKPLANDVEWTPVFREYSPKNSKKLDEMGLNACIQVQNKTSKGVTTCLMVRLGGGLVNTMGWKAGDTVIVCYNPDDIYHLCLMKHEKGYKLASESTDKFAVSSPHKVNLSCKWLTHETEKSKSTPQEITIDKKLGRIYFRLNIVR